MSARAGGELEDTVAALVERAERLFLGKYRGLVAHNDDPDGLGRLRVRVPSVFGADAVTGWAWPCAPFGGAGGQGWWTVPEVGAGIWVEFEEGDLDFPVWVGTYWSRPGGTSEVPLARDAEGAEAGVAGPTRRLFTSAAGHTIQFEDGNGKELVLIHEATHGRTVALDADGITITDGTSSLRWTSEGLSVDTTTFTVTAGAVRFVERKATP